MHMRIANVRACRAVGALLVLLCLCGCATSETYYDVEESELTAGTLWPGLKLDVEYQDGTQAKIVVAEVTDESILANDGTEWPKSGIHKLKVKGLSNSSDCGSLHSWNNYQCWKDDLSRQISSR